MSAPVIIYDTSLNKVAYLPKAFDVSYQLRANEVGRAWFSVPTDDTHLSEIVELRYAEIYDGDRRIELFRILKSEKGQGGGKDYQRFECEHVLGTLVDDEFDAIFYEGAAGTTDALTDILAEQGTSRWQLGTNAFAEAYLYEWARGTSLLKAVLDVPKRFQEGYFWTYDTTSYPWTINLIAPPTTVTAYIDYGRNMKSIKRKKDLSELVTKLYPHGSNAGADQIDITSEEPSGFAYITNNTATYGTIVHHWTDQRYTTAAELYAAAQEYLTEISEPAYTYWIEAADIYRLTGESIDLFTIGALVRVDNPEIDITTEVRVMEIKKGDVTGKPGNLALTFANKGQEFDLSPKVAVNDLSNINITDMPGGTPGALPGDPGDAGLYITTDYLGYWDGALWATYMDITGKLYAQQTDAYFRFDPSGSGTLSIKCTAVDIDGVLNVVNTANIVDAAVTNAKIDTMTVSKLTTGTLDAQVITLANAGAIKLGKVSYADTTAGFWLGEGGVNALFNIGDATSFFKWTGSGILFSGSITGDLSADLDMNSHAFTNCGDFRGTGYAANVQVFNPTTYDWYGEDANTYILLDKDSGSIRWAGVGTVYAGSDLYLDTAGDIILEADLDFSNGSTTGKTGANVYVAVKNQGISGYYLRLYT